MMQCFVCHLTQLEPIDAYAKHKGLMNYNKKHSCYEHPNLYKKWGLFLLQKVAETQSEKQGTKKRKLVPPSQITNFFGNQWPYHKSNPLQQAFQTLISFDFKFKFLLSSSNFFLLTFFLCKKSSNYPFLGGIYNIGVQDWRFALCCSIGIS